MVRDLSSTRTSESLCSQEWDHKEISLKKIYGFCKLLCIESAAPHKRQCFVQNNNGKKKAMVDPFVGKHLSSCML